VFIESNHRDAPIKPLSSGERAILTKLCHWHDDSDATSAALGSPETPVWGAQEATAFPNCRIVCPPWWLGKSRQKHLAAVTFMAQFAFKFTARTQTTHRPTSHGPWPMLSVFDRPWPDNDILRCSGPTGTKRRQKRLSSVILACFWPHPQRDAAQLLPYFCCASFGYYYLSSSPGLLHEVAQVLSYGP